MLFAATMSTLDPPAQSQTEVASIDLSFGRFDALRAEHFVHRFPPHFHESFAIGVIEDGEACIRTHRGAWTARPGSILAFSPGEVHGAESLGTDGYTYRMIYPPQELMREISAVATRPLLFETPVIEDLDVASRLREAHVALMAGEWKGRAESALVTGLRDLTHRHARSESTTKAVRSLDLEVAERARNYLQDRWTQTVRLPDLAEECGITTFHLIRAFRRVMGVPPYAYLLQLRVNRAQAMLVSGSSVSDVAYSCGFCDQSHLNRVFKKAVGVPPGQYVRRVRRHAA